MADGGRLDTGAAERRGKKGRKKNEEEEEEEEEGPREPTAKLAAATTGRNTATRSVLNRTQPSREAARGRRGEQAGQEQEVGFLRGAAARGGPGLYCFVLFCFF